jgi:hypothetical protein
MQLNSKLGTIKQLTVSFKYVKFSKAATERAKPLKD